MNYRDNDHITDWVFAIVALALRLMALTYIAVSRPQTTPQVDLLTELEWCEADESRIDCRIEWDEGDPAVYWRASREDM